MFVQLVESFVNFKIDWIKNDILRECFAQIIINDWINKKDPNKNISIEPFMKEHENIVFPKKIDKKQLILKARKHIDSPLNIYLFNNVLELAFESRGVKDIMNPKNYL